MKSIYLLITFIVMLIGLAFVLPSNTLTGRMISSPVCGEMGCVQLCDSASVDGIDGAAAACEQGLVCCPTHWDTGVCDYNGNCEKIREFSLYQSLAEYQDSVRESPAPIRPDFEQFFLPIIVIIVFVAFVIFKYRNPKTELR